MTAVPRIDPRLRERRVAVQRELGRRRLRLLLLVFGTFGLVSLGYAALHSSLVDVDRIEVSGAQQSGSAAVREAARVESGDALLLIDTGRVARRVEELPWVVEARVTRRVPGTLRISVTEQRATVYVARATGEVVLVGRDGTVLGEAARPPDGSVELVGLRSVPEPGELVSPPAVGGVSEALPARLMSSVRAVELARRDVAVLLDGGGEIRLGALSDLESKGAVALAVIDRLAGEPFEYVDVSVPSAPVVSTAAGEDR